MRLSKYVKLDGTVTASGAWETWLTHLTGQREADGSAIIKYCGCQRYMRPQPRCQVLGKKANANHAAVADAIRTSLGPRGMDKMIRSGKGETIITNDGSTMLKSMSVMHPTAKMLVNLSNAQDVEAGDGTTSVVVLCGSLLGAADRLLGKGIHPSVISEAFQRAATAAVEVLHGMSQPISLSDTASLLQAANTSLSSKIVSQYSGLLGPMAVNAVLKTIDLKTADNVDLRNIRIVKKVGGTIEDSELVDGLVLMQPVIKSAGGPVRMEKARIGLIQFQLSPPKPDVNETHRYEFGLTAPAAC
jgi:T-complex protein 1 subunit delta